MARHRNPGTKHLRAIRKALTAIDRSLRQIAPMLSKAASAAAKEWKPRRKVTMTPKRRAALKLQGQYMGYMRGLPARKKAQVKAVKEKRGVEAAIAVAKRLGKRAA